MGRITYNDVLFDDLELIRRKFDETNFLKIPLAFEKKISNIVKKERNFISVIVMFANVNICTLHRTKINLFDENRQSIKILFFSTL